MNSPLWQSCLFNDVEGSGDDRLARTRALKDLVRKHFGLAMNKAVFIAEITCGEQDCPDAETIIAILENDRRREYRILKPVCAITGADIADLSRG
ncbi:MAG: hypothetical protein KDJ29_18375 [Hyphomicrobiales bacterium]|nr:hypothetical protein [Hyphomicrobiales bacterium]